MSSAQSKETPTKKNLTYIKDTAGDQMITKIPKVSENSTVKDVLEILAKGSWDSISLVYVLDEKDSLVGYVSIKKLIAAQEEKIMKEILEKIPVVVDVSDDQEKVVYLAIEHDLKAVPVVAKNKNLLGIVPADHIIDILHKEHLEDFLRFSGIRSKGEELFEIVGQRIIGLVGLRLPWLLVGLAGGVIATSVVSFFEFSLKKEIALAFFIPVVAYMGDAIGTQTETIFIRSLSLVRLNLAKYVLKEFFTGLIIGFVCGVLAFFFTLFWLSSIKIAMIVGLSLLVSMAVASVLAIIIPLFLYKLGKDPAIGSGPFTTALQDIVSLLIYFSIALIIL